MQWIRRHRRGRSPHPEVLTPTEWRVLEHVRQGPNAEIAVRLGVSINTVRAQVSSILAKTGLPTDTHSRSGMGNRARRRARSCGGASRCRWRSSSRRGQL